MPFRRILVKGPDDAGAMAGRRAAGDGMPSGLPTSRLRPDRCRSGDGAAREAARTSVSGCTVPPRSIAASGYRRVGIVPGRKAMVMNGTLARKANGPGDPLQGGRPVGAPPGVGPGRAHGSRMPRPLRPNLHRPPGFLSDRFSGPAAHSASWRSPAIAAAIAAARTPRRSPIPPSRGQGTRGPDAPVRTQGKPPAIPWAARAMSRLLRQGSGHRRTARKDPATDHRTPTLAAPQARCLTSAAGRSL